jgi:hypothetical protein
MVKQSALTSFKKTSAILQAAVIATAALLPAALLSSSASGAQLDNRFIDMSSTASFGGDSTEGSGRASGTDVTYTVGFDIGTSGNIAGLVIDFCSNSPITGLTCTAPTGFNVNEGTLALANQRLNGGALGNTYTIDAATTNNRLVLTSTANSFTAGDSVLFDLGTTSAGDGITNPSTVGSFYARIITYTSAATAQAYTSTSPGTFVDDGGIALSIARELTITARVQEVLEFCIGTDADSTLANAGTDSCTLVAGTDLDLGVVDSNSIAKTSTIDTPNDGIAMIRTNASQGAVMYYKAEQNTSSGKLKIAGGTCVGTNLNDPCFNSLVQPKQQSLLVLNYSA